MSKITTPDNMRDVPLSFLNNMVALATSGFGIVVALAWNDAIKAAVNEYIDPYLGKGGGILSLFIYAIIITFLAVFVAMQLAQIQKKMADLDDKIQGKDDDDSDGNEDKDKPQDKS